MHSFEFVVLLAAFGFGLFMFVYNSNPNHFVTNMEAEKTNYKML